MIKRHGMVEWFFQKDIFYKNLLYFGLLKNVPKAKKCKN